MALTANQQAVYDEIKQELKEIKELCQNSLAIQNVGGYVITNRLLALEPKLDELETA